MKTKIFSSMVLFLFTLSSVAQDLQVQGNASGYTNSGGVLTIQSAGSYTVSMSSGIDTTYTNRILISATGSDTVSVTLSDVHINLSSITSTPAFDITGSAPVKLLLAGTNSLASGSKCAGLQKSDTACILILGGSGSLTATGGFNGAGIGGGNGGAGTHITITGGILTATGGSYATGIGGGNQGAGTHITITGGILTATGGSSGAGIGGGYKGAGTHITIAGGTLTAMGGGYGAGIGGGRNAAGSYITITGGTLTATGGIKGAGIGGGYHGAGSNITITGGSITATGGTYGAGIGGGQGGAGSDITLTGGSIKAVGDTSNGVQDIGNGYGSGASAYTPTHGSSNLTCYSYTFAGQAGKTVTNITGLPSYYNTTGLVTDSVGKIYLWLPNTAIPVVNAYINGTHYISETKENETSALMVISSIEFSITSDIINGFTCSSNALNITKSGSYTLSMASGITSTTTNRILISATGSDTVSVTLSDVHINLSSIASTPAFDITGSAPVKLLLAGTNSLASGENRAGLQKSDTACILILGGSGSLTATGGFNGAGIGGGNQGAGTHITITGGSITAIGGDYGAGIGGGESGAGSDITITGGSINVTQNSGGQQIGNGFDSGEDDYTPTNGQATPQDVSIFIATLTEKANTTVNSITGLPAYYNASNLCTDSEGKLYLWLPDSCEGDSVTVTFSDSTTTQMTLKTNRGLHVVTTNGSSSYKNGALTLTTAGDYTISMEDGFSETTDRIVVSAASATDTVKITLNSVNISSPYSALNIMGDAPVCVMTASGTTNSLTSGVNYAGLQKSDSACFLTLGGSGTLTATGGSNAAGIGGGNGGSGNHITLTGGTLTATGGNSGAGIGGGKKGAGSHITIAGGILTARGGNMGAGIGGGMWGAGSHITIEGGTLTATGGFIAAGIGGGSENEGSYITLTGGTLTATGGDGAAGIGGGMWGAGSHITIEGGTLTAIGGDSGAGIGGGSQYEGSYITITGGTHITITGGSITAIGGDYGAGIGGGNKGACSNITIEGGTLTATGGTNAAGIGGGYKGAGTHITITGGSIKAVGDTAQNIGNGAESSASTYTPTSGSANGSAALTLYTYTFTGLAGTDITHYAGLPSYFGTKDVKTDASGNIYLYLPQDYSLTPKVEDSCSIATGYGTLCYPAPVPLINDVTAYTLTGSDANGYVTYTQVSDTIPAHTPVLLCGSEGASLARPTVLYNASASSLSNGVMKGTYQNLSAPVGSYVLQKQNTLLAFYKVATGKQPVVKAFRGYVQLTGSGINVLRIGDGTLDGIETPVNDNETLDDFTIYDLAGRKVLQPVKGKIYIVNGKKAIFK